MRQSDSPKPILPARAPARYTPPSSASNTPPDEVRRGEAAERPEDARRIVELDGLRGIAVALVILLHYGVRRQASLDALQQVPRLWALLEMSWSGVDLFFVISGFLIGGILLDHRESPQLLRAFYVRRACRILPLYGALLAVSFAPVFGGLSAASGSPIPLAAYLVFAQNFWTSAGVRAALWLAPTWSVAIEEQFYLLAPFAVRLLSRRALVRVVLASIVIAPLLRVASAQGLLPFSSWDFTLCRIDAPAYGVLGALLVRDAAGVAMLRRHATTLRRALPLLLAGWVALSQLLLAQSGRTVLFTIGLSYLALTALVLLLVVKHHPGSIAGRIARATPLVWIGRRSYFLYLFHVPLMAVLRILPVTFPVRVVVAIALLLVLAEASWRYVEAPILNAGRRFRYA
jgi:peptidoglycan/LPS O-acetylase OafA/YrhL